MISGGLCGSSILFEAVRAGLSATLIEAGDFGSSTSWNSLRILDGGVEYLRPFNLRRLASPLRERRFYQRAFPELVQSVNCIMPLYRDGLRRHSVMRTTIALNRILSVSRNHAVPGLARLGSAATLDATATQRACP